MNAAKTRRTRWRTQRRTRATLAQWRAPNDVPSCAPPERYATEAEADEMWSFVQRKTNPRWLWHAIDHRSGMVLAYVFGRRQDEAFPKLKALLVPFGITKYYTDYWGAYIRHIDMDKHAPGKRNTQKIERKHLTLRTRKPTHPHLHHPKASPNGWRSGRELT